MDGENEAGVIQTQRGAVIRWSSNPKADPTNPPENGRTPPAIPLDVVQLENRKAGEPLPLSLSAFTTTGWETPARVGFQRLRCGTLRAEALASEE